MQQLIVYQMELIWCTQQILLAKKILKAVLDKLILYSKINNNKQVFVAYYIPVHYQLFSDYKEITKVFERFTKNKTEAEMAVFRINQVGQIIMHSFCYNKKM